jgi:hypothetical protein
VEDRTKPPSAYRFEEQESLSFDVPHGQNEGLLSGRKRSFPLTRDDFRCQLPPSSYPWQVPVV